MKDRSNMSNNAKLLIELAPKKRISGKQLNKLLETKDFQDSSYFSIDYYEHSGHYGQEYGVVLTKEK